MPPTLQHTETSPVKTKIDSPLPSSLSFRLSVRYPPVLTLTSKRERVLEGDAVRFRCVARSSPVDGGGGTRDAMSTQQH